MQENYFTAHDEEQIEACLLFFELFAVEPETLDEGMHSYLIRDNIRAWLLRSGEDDYVPMACFVEAAKRNGFDSRPVATHSDKRIEKRLAKHGLTQEPPIDSHSRIYRMRLRHQFVKPCEQCGFSRDINAHRLMMGTDRCRRSRSPLTPSPRTP